MRKTINFQTNHVILAIQLIPEWGIPDKPLCFEGNALMMANIWVWRLITQNSGSISNVKITVKENVPTLLPFSFKNSE